MVLQAPPRETWKFCLRTVRRYCPEVTLTAVGYDESHESVHLTHPDGVAAPTVFFNSENAKNRLLRQGWEDVTAMWDEHAAAQAPPPKTKGKITVPIRGDGDPAAR